MIVVRNVFTAKPGSASTLAAQLKTAAGVAGLSNHRVLTDLTGGFNRVVLEYEVETLSGFENTMSEYATNEEFRAAMAGYTDHWITGEREFLKIA